MYIQRDMFENINYFPRKKKLRECQITVSIQIYRKTSRSNTCPEMGSTRKTLCKNMFIKKTIGKNSYLS